MNLIRYPDPILNRLSREVLESELDDVAKSIDHMTKIMQDNNGVGLAAVQVGILKRYALLDMTKDSWKDPSLPDVLLVINPTLVSEFNPINIAEGCLSLPRFNEVMTRASEITVKYKNIAFEDKTITLTGLMSQCLLHELDHMQGLLQINKMSLMKQEMYKKALKKRGLL